MISTALGQPVDPGQRAHSAQPARGDEVVLVLNTGGGTVTGYGLAAAQLLRLKEAGLHLTICVEQVAASGGYMMACTADRLVAVLCFAGEPGVRNSPSVQQMFWGRTA